jgi:c-di-GMP-binding flagellar brake protein YcgR
MLPSQKKILEREPAMVNRRKRIRFVERNAVRLKPARDRSRNRGVNGVTYDLSTGGARIVTPEFFDVGTVLRIHIYLARSRQTVTLEGEVRWFRARPEDGSFELGVEFLHLVSHTILSLIRHLYSQDEGLPSAVS